jgi:hypothetical protein
MFLRSKFVTNSSSAAYIMWGVELDREELNTILQSLWLNMPKQDREAVWADYKGDAGTDVNNWGAVYEYLNEDFGFGEFSDTLLDKSKLDIHEADQDDGRYILYVKESWHSVDRGELRTFTKFRPTHGWLPEIARVLNEFNINQQPEWFILGAG